MPELRAPTMTLRAARRPRQAIPRSAAAQCPGFCTVRVCPIEQRVARLRPQAAPGAFDLDRSLRPDRLRSPRVRAVRLPGLLAAVAKPVDAFPKRKYPEANRAYHALISSDRQGRYWMPRANAHET